MIVSSPGKLMFAGEWAVLESGVPCIAMAVDKRIFVEIKEAEKISVKAKDIELGKKEGVFEENKMKWENLKENDDKRILFAGIKGLIFTPESLERMARNGITISEVTEVVDSV